MPAAQSSVPAAATQPSTLASQTDIVGIWQGTLHVAAAADHPEINLRILNKIIRNDKAELRVAGYIIDQSGQAMIATSASFANGVLKYSIEGIGGKYEGTMTMSADGKTITGAWT